MKKIGAGKRAAALLMATAVLLLCGCRADISAYGKTPILIVGLLEEDFTVTPEELVNMKCVSGIATGSSAKAGTVQGWGPTLETFVERYGHTLDEFKCVTFYASDDYHIALGPVTWEKRDVILSVANGGKPLEAGQCPLRVVIPGADSGKWIRMVDKIQFTYLKG